MFNGKYPPFTVDPNTGAILVSLSGSPVVGSDIKTGTTAGNTVNFQAYNTTSSSYITFGTLTAGPAPSFAVRGHRPSATTFSGTTGTLALTDADLFQVCSNAATQTITVPTNATVAFPIDTEIDFFQQGAGQVVFAAAGGVTIQSISSNLKIASQFGGATLKKLATDTWCLVGDLTS